MSDKVLIAVDLAQWDLAGRATGKYEKFKRPLPSYSSTQASAIEHVQRGHWGIIENRCNQQKAQIWTDKPAKLDEGLTDRYRNSLQIA